MEPSTPSEEPSPGELLAKAIEEGSLAGVRDAIAKGADAAATTAATKGRPPFFSAVSNGYLEIVQCLVEHGADVFAAHPRFGNALLYAVGKPNNREMTTWLLDKGLPVNSTAQVGSTPLHKAGNLGSSMKTGLEADILLTMELLLSRGANINAVYRYQGSWTPLREAIYNDLMPIATFLLERGADVHACDEGIRALLEDAVKNGNIDAAMAVIDKAGDVNAPVRDSTIVHAAAGTGSVDLLTRLIDRGARMNVVDERGDTLAHCAALKNNLDIIKFVVHKGVDINAVNKVSRTSLHYAATMRSGHVLKYLVENHADVNAVSQMGPTPLYNAIFSHKPPDEMPDTVYESVHLLASHGAKLPGENVMDRTDLSKCKDWQLGLLECARHWQLQHANEVPLTDVAKESVQRGAEAVKAYLVAMGSTTAAQLIYRRKICIVGPSEWGKTSLVKSLTTEQPSLVHIDDRTIGIDLFACEFDKPEIGDANGEHHEVTFWDFAGQDVYQVAHALFFSPRTLYVVCVNLEAYTAALDQSETLSIRQGELVMHRFVTQHVLRWIRLIFTRQPDAQFVFVGTKVDRVQDAKAPAIVWRDLRARLFTWKRDMMAEIEEAFSLVGGGGNRSAMLPSELMRVRKREREAKLEELSVKLDAILASEWLLASSAEVEAVKAARTSIESVILRSDRSYRMPRIFSLVLQAILQRRQDAARLEHPKDRIEHMIVPFSALYSWLSREIDGLEAGLFVSILQALHDIGDILWYEKEASSYFKHVIILDPTLVIDYVREVVNHKLENGAAISSVDGRLPHAALGKIPFWKDSDEELTHAFKLLLQHYQLAHPADSRTMDWDSDLIIPAYWKAITEPAQEPPQQQQDDAKQIAGGVTVRWEYELTAELSETVFDHFAVQSYSPTLERSVLRHRIESSVENEFVSCVELQQKNASRDVIHLQVDGVNGETAWRCMRFLVMAMEEVLEDYPGLFVSRYIVSDDAVGDAAPVLVRHRVSDAVSAIEDALAVGRGMETIRASMPWLPLDMAWYMEKAWRTPGKLHEIQLRSNVKQVVDKAEVLKKLVVAGADAVQRRMPALWTVAYTAESGGRDVQVKMLSDLSGECFHDPIVIAVPRQFLADYAPWIQTGVSIISNVVPEVLSMDVVNKAIEFATSSIDASTSQAQAVHCLIDSLNINPATGGSQFNSREAQTLSPRAAMALLRGLLTLHDPEFDELRINDLATLECAATSDGNYVWASRQEISALGDELTPCDPRDWTSAAVASLDPVSSSASTSIKVRLTITGTTQLPAWDWRRAYCSWQLVHATTEKEYGSGTTSPHLDDTKEPSWAAVGFTVTTVPSLEVLRECRLSVQLKRPSRWLGVVKSLGEGVAAVGDAVKSEGQATITVALASSSSPAASASPRAVVCELEVATA